MPSKEEKRLYDIEYRRKNKDRIKARKRAYEQSPPGREMQKRNRIAMKQNHLEYCRTDEYREYKKDYDVEHLAKKRYGEFWECMILAKEIYKKVCELVPDRYERIKIRGQLDMIKARSALRKSIKFGWSYNWGHILPKQ